MSDSSTIAMLAALSARVEALEAELGLSAMPAIAGFSRRTVGWVNHLTSIVASEWGIEPSDVIGRSLCAIHVRPRFVLSWLLRQSSEYSYMQIARLTGRVDHTTIMWAKRRVDVWRETDPGFRLVTDQLLQIAKMIRQNELDAAQAAVAALPDHDLVTA